MPKTKAQTPLSVPDGEHDIHARYYLSDAASKPAHDDRIVFSFDDGKSFDHALSEYTTVTPAQKTALRATLLALRNETYILEGYRS